MLTRTKHILVGVVLGLALLVALADVPGTALFTGHQFADFWPHAPTASQAGGLLAAQGGPGVVPEDSIGPQ